MVRMKETIIYIRTSTEEQNPKNQLEDCKKLAEKLNLKDFEILEERKSAFKDNVKREIFNSIKKAIQKGEVKNLIVWDLDRLYRNRVKTVEFIRNYSKLGLRVYSYRQDWFERFNDIPEPFNEIMSDLMLQIVSWMAEEESKKKGERVKLAVRKEEGKPTKSYKGNVWGRKPLSQSTINQILQLHKQGLSIRKIARQVLYYDKNNNKKNVSIAVVHKIISQNNT